MEKLISPENGAELHKLDDVFYTTNMQGDCLYVINNDKIIPLLDSYSKGRLEHIEGNFFYSKGLHKKFFYDETNGNIIPLFIVDESKNLMEDATLFGDVLVGNETKKRVLIDSKGEPLTQYRMFVNYVNEYLLQNRIYQMETEQKKKMTQEQLRDYNIVQKKLSELTENDIQYMMEKLNLFPKSSDEYNMLFSVFKDKLQFIKNAEPEQEKIKMGDVDLYNSIENVLKKEGQESETKPLSLPSNHDDNIFQISLNVKQNGFKSMSYADFKYLFETLDIKGLIDNCQLDNKDIEIAQLILSHLETKENNKTK